MPISYLSAAQISALDLTIFQQLSSTKIGQLTQTQVGALNLSAVESLSTAQAAALSASQVKGLTTTQIPHVPDAVVFDSNQLLALGFLLMIGAVLIADGFGVHVPKGYIYAAMAFSGLVEALNLAARRRRAKKEPADH